MVTTDIVDAYFNSDEFGWFLDWLAEGKCDDHEWSASEIISIVKEPRKYQKQYNQYLKEEVWK